MVHTFDSFQGFRNLDKDGGIVSYCMETLALYNHRGSQEPDIIALAFVGRDYTDQAVENIAKKLPKGQKLWAFSPIHRKIDVPGFLKVTHTPAKTNRELRGKIASHLQRFIQNLPEGTPLSPRRIPFPSYHVNVGPSERLRPGTERRFTVSQLKNGLNFDYFLDLKPDTKKLVVLGQDAISRSRTQLPYFFRWKWAHRINASVMIWNDPCLQLADQLDAAWWIGTSDKDIVRDGVEIVLNVASSMGVKNEDIIFVGMSAGGFSALQMATLVRGSKAIADIPRLTLLQDGRKGKTADLAINSLMGFESASTVPDYLLPQIDVLSRMRQEEYVPEFVILQNTLDTAHMVPQYGYFKERFSEQFTTFSGNRKFIEYSQWHPVKGGHFPLKESVMLGIIERVMDNDFDFPVRFSRAEITMD